EAFRTAEWIEGGGADLPMNFAKQCRLTSHHGLTERAVGHRRTRQPGNLTCDDAPVPASAHVQVGHLSGEVVAALTHLDSRLHRLTAGHAANRPPDAAAQKTPGPAAARRQVRLHDPVE